MKETLTLYAMATVDAVKFLLKLCLWMAIAVPFIVVAVAIGNNPLLGIGLLWAFTGTGVFFLLLLFLVFAYGAKG